MSRLKLHKAEFKGMSGEKIHLVYDETTDMMDIFFGENIAATGIELTEHILLRLARATGRAVSLTLLHFSILTEQTEYGPRSYPLDTLEDLPEDLRESVLLALKTAPVNQFLKLCHFQEAPTKQIPLAYVEAERVASVA